VPATLRRSIDDHVRLLRAWNAAINLTAIRDADAIATLHVLDSLSAVPTLRRLGVDRFVDLGSGGGFPGLPVALALPASDVLLVDSVAKKAAFLSTVVRATGADRVRVFTGRAEALAVDPSQREAWPAVTARAVADLAELVELSFPLLRRGGSLVAWKRGDLDAELEAGRRAADALGGADMEVVDPGVAALATHRLVIVTKAGRTPVGYPRDPGDRRRHPW
jgi:16S rRNA (guanine527-N7)-methyltransferase